jgi:uncharacterized protein YkwD
MSPPISRWIVTVLPLSMMASAYGQSAEEMDTESLERAESPAVATDRVDSSAATNRIVQLTNAFRGEQGLDAVEINPHLMEAAQYFARFMARTDKYGHAADGSRPSERASRHKYEYCLVSENIAYQFNSLGFTTEELATKFVEGWKESPGHRKNMLDPAVIDTGVAVARSDKTGYWYAVQMFGRPQSSAIEFTISNESNVDVAYSIGKRKFQLPPRYTRTHTRCRKVEVDFATQLVASDKSITPANGARYAIESQNGGLRLNSTSSNAP